MAATLIQRFYPTLRPGDHLRAVTGSSKASLVHVRQGQLDGACGLHCIVMALIAMGLASRAQLRSLPAVESDRFDLLWRRSLDTYFTGLDGDELAALLATVGNEVAWDQYEGAHNRVLQFAIRAEWPSLVILGWISQAREHGHWVLVVGSEWLESDHDEEIIALLCLDPAIETPRGTAYNARLELTKPRRGAKHLHYVRMDGRRTSVTCTDAFSLRLVSQP